MREAERDDVAALVRASVDGDPNAWAELVGRYAHLVTIVVRQYRLPPPDEQDVAQTVWLRLVEHLSHLREPSALPGWLATTARHESLRHLRSNRRSVTVDPADMSELDGVDVVNPDADLLAAERHQVLLDGLAELPPHQRRLLALLAADPPYSYAEISRILDIPVGSIGPTRSRVVNRLRETGAVRGYRAGRGVAQRCDRDDALD